MTPLYVVVPGSVAHLLGDNNVQSISGKSFALPGISDAGVARGVGGRVGVGGGRPRSFAKSKPRVPKYVTLRTKLCHRANVPHRAQMPEVAFFVTWVRFGVVVGVVRGDVLGVFYPIERRSEATNRAFSPV